MENMRYNKEDLQQALQVLRSGGIIVYPTDTVWGIGCDATNLKQREDSKSMLVLLDSAAKLNYYVDVPEAAEMLLGVQNTDRFADGAQTDLQDEATKPLTLIYPNARHLAQNLIAEDGSIGIRITSEPPIVSTSANISGHPSARFFHEIEQAILEGADYVCLFRREDETPHQPSTIIKINADNSFKIIRQ